VSTQALAASAYVRALLIALRLGDPQLLQHSIMSVPLAQVTPTAKQLPALFLQQLLSSTVQLLEDSPHMEFLLCWVKALLVAHGPALAAAAGGATALRAAVVGGGSSGASAAAAAAGGGVVSTLRALQQVVGKLHQDLSSTAEGNVYLLNYLVEAGKLQQQQQSKEQQQGEEQQEEEQGQQKQQHNDQRATLQQAAAKQQKAPKKQKQKQKRSQ
jgi:periodic tryptophan protein 2